LDTNALDDSQSHTAAADADESPPALVRTRRTDAVLALRLAARPRASLRTSRADSRMHDARVATGDFLGGGGGEGGSVGGTRRLCRSVIA